MLFCEISKRHSSDSSEDIAAGGSGRYVQQFKFLRLSPTLDYEMIAMGLKGLQLSLRPGGFLTPGQYKSSAKHRELFHSLVDWGCCPGTISEPEIMAFLGHIYDGLSSEYRGKPAHGKEHIAAVLDQMKQSLMQFNDLVGR